MQRNRLPRESWCFEALCFSAAKPSPLSSTCGQHGAGSTIRMRWSFCACSILHRPPNMLSLHAAGKHTSNSSSELGKHR
eukprot:scaffold196093_cov17-Tisochrysis_lutea.AAC.1